MLLGFPQFGIIPHSAVIPPAKVPLPFVSSLHLSVQVAPDKEPTLIVLADCISVDTYRLPVLVEVKLVVLVVAKPAAVTDPAAVVESALSEAIAVMFGCFCHSSVSTCSCV